MSEFVFPQDRPDGNGGYQREGGMTLRDYFAAQALAGIIGNITVIDGKKDPIFAQSDEAYRYADAMLAARERKP